MTIPTFDLAKLIRVAKETDTNLNELLQAHHVDVYVPFMSYDQAMVVYETSVRSGTACTARIALTVAAERADTYEQLLTVYNTLIHGPSFPDGDGLRAVLEHKLVFAHHSAEESRDFLPASNQSLKHIHAVRCSNVALANIDNVTTSREAWQIASTIGKNHPAYTIASEKAERLFATALEEADTIAALIALRQHAAQHEQSQCAEKMARVAKTFEELKTALQHTGLDGEFDTLALRTLDAAPSIAERINLLEHLLKRVHPFYAVAPCSVLQNEIHTCTVTELAEFQSIVERIERRMAQDERSYVNSSSADNYAAALAEIRKIQAYVVGVVSAVVKNQIQTPGSLADIVTVQRLSHKDNPDIQEALKQALDTQAKSELAAATSIAAVKEIMRLLPSQHRLRALALRKLTELNEPVS